MKYIHNYYKYIIDVERRSTQFQFQYNIIDGIIRLI